MTSTPVGERAPRAPQVPYRAGVLLPLVLLGSLAFGYWVVTAFLAPHSSQLPEAKAQVGPGPSASPAVSPAVSQAAIVTASPAKFTEASGLKIRRVGISGDGGIIDVRYTVMDEKLAELHASHRVPPAVIDSTTGKVLETGWMGHAHPPTDFQPNRTYWILLLNSGELIERGDRVAVRIGHAELTGVRVR